MVARLQFSRLLSLLLLSVAVVTGCAQFANRPDGQPRIFAKQGKKGEEGPPPPAPALYIAGPAATPTAVLPSTTAPTPTTPPMAETPTSSVLTEPLPAKITEPLVNVATALPPLVAAPSQPAEASSSLAPMRELYQKAAQKHAGMDSYTLRLRRREVVGNQSRPEEVLLFKFRKEPWSVYFKWLGNEGKGREVVYVKGRYDNALHTLTAAGDIPLLPAGRHIKVAPEGVLVKSKSRYPITEAGLGGLIERFGRLVKRP